MWSGAPWTSACAATANRETVRAVPAAPADVIARALKRQTPEGMVQRRDAQLRPVAVFRQCHRRHQPLVHIGQKGVVDLQMEPGIDNRPVFLVQGVGQSEQKALLVVVMFVSGIGQRARRRHHRQKALYIPNRRNTGLQVVDVPLQLGLAAICDQSGHHGPDRRRGVAQHLPVVFAVELGKRFAVAPADCIAHRIGRFLRAHRLPLDAAQAVVNVERPVDRLAVFAVAHDVHSGFGLKAHRLGDRFGQARVVGVAVPGLVALLLFQELDQRRRPDQTADMAHWNAFGLRRHCSLQPDCRSGADNLPARPNVNRQPMFRAGWSMPTGAEFRRTPGSGPATPRAASAACRAPSRRLPPAHPAPR